MALTERKLEIVAWDKPGTIIEGRLVLAQKVKYDDGVGVKYVVRARNGVIVAFRGSTRIDMCLHPGDVGKMISVEYRGIDTTATVKQGFSQPKLFIVCVDDDSVQRAAPGDDGAAAITDDDIPF